MESLNRPAPILLVPALPAVEALPGDPVVPARHGDVAGHLLGMAQHRKPVTHHPIQHRFAHDGLRTAPSPDCQRCPSVLDTVAVGFEPTEELPPHTLSSSEHRPSATAADATPRCRTTACSRP